jgi:CBS domain-containing protein
MASIHDLIRDRETYTVNAEEMVLAAARFMVERNIGAVPVLERGELAGIFSERDIMKRVLAAGRDPRTTPVSEVMTRDLTTVPPGESLENCMLLMREHGFRHLPVCEGKRLVGLVSLRDLLLRDLTEKDAEVKMMRAYIHSDPGGSA